MRHLAIKTKMTRLQLQNTTGVLECVQYATACADTVPALKPFQNICKPTFVFLAAGRPVGFVHGAHSGKLLKELQTVGKLKSFSFCTIF